MVDTPSPERPSEMRRAVRTWLTHLDVERGVSPHTLAAYRRDSERYLSHLEESGVTAPGDVRPYAAITSVRVLSDGVQP